MEQVDPLEREEGELLASEEEDPNLHQGDPSLTQLVMTEEEQQDLDSFAVAVAVDQAPAQGPTPFPVSNQARHP